MATKGEQTRQAILGHAMELAGTVGLAGLTIGRLADDLNLSKSGLFAHFQSKEALQSQVIEAAGARFTTAVVEPALAAPKGAARLWALFERWVDWALAKRSGGCLLVGASMELDDQPGAVRETLVKLQRSWVHFLETTVEGGRQAGELLDDLDPALVAQQFHGILLGVHLHHRLLHDTLAVEHGRRSVAALLASISARPGEVPAAAVGLKARTGAAASLA